MSSIDEATEAATEAVGRVDIQTGENVEEATPEETVEMKDVDDELPALEGSKPEEDEDDISSSTSSTESEGANIVTSDEASEKLVQATQQKEEGNTFFNAGDLEKAARCYRRGANSLKPLRKNPAQADDPQIKSLLVALQTNLSMVLYKQGKYNPSVQIASKALSVEKTNVKVLYRRAAAQRKLGNLEEARADLKLALQYDSNNTACKKELVAVKKEMEQSKANQKKALAKAFARSGSSFLYDDKEDAEKKKKERERQKKIQEQELYKKRKIEWEDECVKRMANNEPAIPFEEWEKALKEKEEKERKEQEAKRKEEEKRRKEEQRKRRKQERKEKKEDESEHDSDDELTKEELAMMRGYKKTADGRTTSYFTRELSESEKQHIGDIAPKRLDTSVTPPPTSGNRLKPSSEGASAWNAAGTWEEKDTTKWCSDHLRKCFEETDATVEPYECSVVSVDTLTGDASFAIAGGKKRYIFDFHAKLDYEVKDVESDKVVAKGSVGLPDICSTSHEELEVSFEAWKQSPPPDRNDLATRVREQLAIELRKTVKSWVQDFNNQY